MHARMYDVHVMYMRVCKQVINIGHEYDVQPFDRPAAIAKRCVCLHLRLRLRLRLRLSL